MSDPLAWVAAVGGVLATIGTWTGPPRARWHLHAETIRNSQDRRENELHRMRFAEVWNWQNSQPQGPEHVRSARWYGEWTRRDAPYCGGLDPGSLTPGLHSADADDAYDAYIDDLAARYSAPVTNTLPVTLRRRSRLRRLLRRRKPGGQVT